MAAAPGIVLVSDQADALARRTMMALRAQGGSAVGISPGTLGDLRVSLREDLFSVAGQVVCGILPVPVLSRLPLQPQLRRTGPILL
jgi:hypothetical protein